MADPEGRTEVFELRFETLAPGVAPAVLRRSPLTMATLCSPRSCWWIASGARAAGRVSLYRWSSLTDRQSQANDWREELQARGLLWNGSVGPIRDVESWIMRESIHAQGLTQEAPTHLPFHELRTFRALNGSAGEAAKALAEHELVQLRSAGAVVTGLYEVALGPDRPMLVLTTAWPDGSFPSDDWLAVDASAETARRRLDERSRHRRRLIGLVETMLLEPLEP
jgi:hypothetical protein